MDLKVNCKVSLKSEGLWHDEAEPAAPSTHLEASLVQTTATGRANSRAPLPPGEVLGGGVQVCSRAEETPSTNALFFFFFNVDHCFTVFTELVTIFLLFYVLGWGFVFFFSYRACGILLPSKGLNPHSLHWKTKS